MSQLIINNHLIDEPIQNILYQIKKEIKTNKLKDIQINGDDIKVTCPFHNNGQEKEPDCHIKNSDEGELQYGTFHCFACDESGNLCKFIAGCFDEEDENFGKQWLLDHYGNIFVERKIILPEITLTKEKDKILDESILDTMQEYHPYMLTRKLDLNICKQFKVKYDPKSECLVFPVYDEHNKLRLLTRRSVLNKTFIIDKNAKKPVYLLNECLKQHLKSVILVESQINALYAWSLGYPAIAMIGKGSTEQYQILNKCGIRHFILCFDGDEAGDKGRDRFIKSINSSIMIDIVNVPRGKDLNDLSKEQVDELFKDYKKVKLC